MKDFNEILSHVNAIDAANERIREGSWSCDANWVRKKNLEALACKVADELLAGRPVPVFNHAESITRIDGVLTQLANELVRQHDMAIAHRTHLADALEKDGGENGAKAAAILRGMNAPADSKAALLRTRGENFTGNKPRGEASDEVEWPKRQVAALEAALREHGKRIREARAARQAEEEAELRGFYKGRDQAWRLLMENQKRHPDTIKVSRAFLGDFQRDLLHMQKEG